MKLSFLKLLRWKVDRQLCFPSCMRLRIQHQQGNSDNLEDKFKQKSLVAQYHARRKQTYCRQHCDYATSLTTNESSANSWQGQESFLHKRRDSSWDPTQCLFNGYCEFFPPTVKGTGREAHCSLSSGTVVMKTWSYNSISPYAFIISESQVSMYVINGKISGNVVMKGNSTPSCCTISERHIWKGLRIF